ncbi:zinc finger (CCCH-type/C3HC4-type RING finger) family protein isoform X1 [Carex rostrata]
MSKRVLCKFYMHGACLKGEYCEFSHDRTDPPNNICTFYQRGVCSYGARCRYDHVKPSRSQPITPPLPIQSNSRPSASYPSLSPPSSLSQVKPTWSTESHILSEPTGSIPVNPEEMPICSFAAAGLCPYGETCMQMHGDSCPVCGKLCLHPYRPEEREEHLRLCQRNNRRLEALRKSQDIECSVCLEKVLSKPTASERKFGLLSECDHPFCVSCIRNWRSNSLHDSGIDVNQAVRACPICRRLSYYVIPSVLWYFSKEEKDEIMDSYKAKLKSIDCKYFDFGNGSCPFGTSCFYKHAYRDGSLEEIKLRHVDADEGSTVIVKMIRILVEGATKIGGRKHEKDKKLLGKCWPI